MYMSKPITSLQSKLDLIEEIRAGVLLASAPILWPHLSGVFHSIIDRVREGNTVAGVCV